MRFATAQALPHIVLLDAYSAGLENERALRVQARLLTESSEAQHVSRSYSFPLALIAWHSAPVGVDIERVTPCDERFARSICTPEEDAAQRWRGDAELTSLWASKEALAKALGDALRYDPRRLQSPIGWRHGASGPWRAEPRDVGDGYRAWVCWHTGA